MNNNRTQYAANDIPVLSGVNFYSTFNPVLWCGMTAIELERNFPALFNRPAGFVLLVAAFFMLPTLFNTRVSSYLMARFPCRNILSCAKVAEVLTALVLLFIHLVQPEFMLPLTLSMMTMLLGIEYAMYRPALRVFMASTLPKSKLSEAVGKVQGGALLGAAFGVVVVVVGRVFRVDPLWGGLVFALFSIRSLILATRIRTADALQPWARFTLLRRLRQVRWENQNLRQELRISLLGEIYIITLLIFILSLTAQYGNDILNNICRRPGYGELSLMLLLVLPLIGGAIGCFIAGKISRNRVELGLIPGAGVLLVALLAALGIIASGKGGVYQYALLGSGLFVLGAVLGILMVPFQSFQEFFVRRDLLPVFFVGYYRKFGLGIITAVIVTGIAYYYKQQVPMAFYALALLTIGLLGLAFRMMPHILLRAGAFILLRTLYRLEVDNQEKIPEEGGALLVANRSSFVDMLFITGATSRPVRFMMYEHFNRATWLRTLCRAAGFLEVPSNKPKKLQQLFAKTREMLRSGEIICVFPEGNVTRNGVMSGFRDGVKEMIPDDVNVPVIPVHIGMTWGSIFSCYYGKFKLQWPEELPHPATVTVGEPVAPETSAYEMRIILSGLGAETKCRIIPGERPFHSQFAWLARRHPKASFIKELRDGKIVRSRHINLLCRCILFSRYLRRKRRGGEYIGIMLPNSIAFFQALTAVLMADRIPAILNYTSSEEARRCAIEKAKLRTIITSRELLAKLKIPAAPGMIFIEDINRITRTKFTAIWWKFLIMILPHAELMKLISPGSWDDPTRTAVVLFSSGSTGIPKGIMLSHHNIFSNVQSVSRSITWSKRDRIPGNLPLFHSFGMAACLWMPLYFGSEVTMLPNPLDATGVGQLLRERKCTVLFATPSFLQLYMRRCAGEDFKTLRLVIAGAEKLRDDIADKFHAMTGLVIAEAYGCTELSPVVSINLAHSVLDLGVKVACRGSVGPALPGICTKIVDPSTFELLPEETDGLLIVKGALVMKGYLDDPEKTNEVIRDNWYVTGDIGRMDRNGFITLTGRLSRFSKIAGEMVPHELVEREINNIILPDTRILAVTGAPDADKGEHLVVFYTDSELLAPEQVIRSLRERKIPNLWIPRSENFIKVDELPMLGSGKLDLAKLAEMARS